MDYEPPEPEIQPRRDATGKHKPEANNRPVISRRLIGTGHRWMFRHDRSPPTKPLTMKYARPYPKSPDGYTIYAVAHYFVGTWNLIRNSDDRILKTGSVGMCLHEKRQRLKNQ